MSYERVNTANGVTVMNKELYDNLQDGIDEAKSSIEVLDNSLGQTSESLLNTKEALDTLTNQVGDITQLDTTDKDNVVGALNEVNTKVENNETSIEKLDTNKANAKDVYTKTEVDEKVKDINDSLDVTNTNVGNNATDISNLTDKVGDTSTLSTTNKTNIVASINEVNTKVDNNKSSITNLSNNKANAKDVYTKSEVDVLISAIVQECDWKESVDTLSDINTTYPNPEPGWTVTVRDTNITYRYNGEDWIDIFTLISKAQLELDKVDNTRDLDKPISTATQGALDELSTKVDNSVDNLNNTKADKTSVYTKTEIDGKVTEINQSISGVSTSLSQTNQNVTSISQSITNITGELSEVSKNVNSSGAGNINKTTVFNEDGSITETTELYECVTVFNEDGSITETKTFSDSSTITKTTTFNEDGSITEVFG